MQMYIQLSSKILRAPVVESKKFWSYLVPNCPLNMLLKRPRPVVSGNLSWGITISWVIERSSLQYSSWISTSTLSIQGTEDKKFKNVNQKAFIQSNININVSTGYVSCGREDRWQSTAMLCYTRKEDFDSHATASTLLRSFFFHARRMDLRNLPAENLIQVPSGRLVNQYFTCHSIYEFNALIQTFQCCQLSDCLAGKLRVYTLDLSQ